MCNHDQIAFLHKDEFFTGAKCINCSQRWGIEDIRDALRDADQLTDKANDDKEVPQSNADLTSFRFMLGL